MSGTNPANLIEIDSIKSFDSYIGQNLVVVDFFATWCGPCIAFKPKYMEIANENPDVKFLKVDVDKHEDLVHKYRIQSMPTFVLIKDGQVVDKFSGANDANLRRSILKNK